MYRIWLFCCLLQFGQSFECYQCNSQFNTLCFSTEYKDSFRNVSCPENACVIVRPPNNHGSEQWIRDCYKKELCDEYSVCKKCDEPLCNSSPRISLSVTYLLIFTALSYYFVMCNKIFRNRSI
ncbi:hypothetical protein PPYR_12538 [Photinus pyralis]|uniref:Protein quiver n=1 Tax=Photinus pyralis TaxID=7054 RepID=A0A1Y1M743_PHOPY|nr:hypothetical protein PPYR_12538 [Photinus pyralis]